MAPVAMYLQDAHPIREGMALVQYAEAQGSVPCGRPRAGSCGKRPFPWRRSSP